MRKALVGISRVDTPDSRHGMLKGKGKGKGKVHLKTGHEGPEGE